MIKSVRKGALAAMAVAALFAAVSAHAACGPADLYGSAMPEGSGADRSVTITPSTKSVNVKYGETVKFVMQGGQEVVWKFDGLNNNFPLATIAGSGSASAGSSGPEGRPIQVYIDQSANPIKSCSE